MKHEFKDVSGKEDCSEEVDGEVDGQENPASLDVDAEVQGEQAQVKDGGDQGQHTQHHCKVCQSFLSVRSLKKYLKRRNVQRKLE